MTQPGIVIVDDEAMITTSLSAMLGLEADYHIEVFNSPQLALSQLSVSTHVPDVVISDYLMPDMTGIEFLKQLRQHCPETTFILLTGYADKENAIAAINEVGIYKYIEKPWDNEDLRQTIANGIERYRLREQLRARIADLEEARASLETMNRELDERVQARTHELSEALDALKEVDRMREDFVATLTHDMRTPLLASIQTLKIMQDGTLGELTPRQVEIVMMLIQNQEDLLVLVNTLLDIYRYEANQQRLILETIPLHQLTQDVINSLQPLAQEREQALVYDNGLHVTVQGDKMALKRVMTNLVGNAIRYTQTGGEVRVSLQHRPEDHQVLWEVLDNGRGIPAADCQKLFQRFAQGTSKHRVTGSGLGLYLSRKIIEAHAGEIAVESEEGKGSRFYFSLPHKGEY